MREVEQRPELRAGAGPAGVAAPVDPDQDGQQRGVLVNLSRTCKRCFCSELKKAWDGCSHVHKDMYSNWLFLGLLETNQTAYKQRSFQKHVK